MLALIRADRCERTAITMIVVAAFSPRGCSGPCRRVWTILDRLLGTSLPAQIVSGGGAAAAGLSRMTGGYSLCLEISLSRGSITEMRSSIWP
jgi:hypothetical protein